MALSWDDLTPAIPYKAAPPPREDSIPPSDRDIALASATPIKPTKYNLGETRSPQEVLLAERAGENTTQANPAGLVSNGGLGLKQLSWDDLTPAAPAKAAAATHVPSERKLGAYGEQMPAPKPPITNPHEGGINLLENIGGAVSEPLTSMVSSAIAYPVSRLAGLATMASPESNPAYPQQVQQNVERQMTYEPRTAAGAAVNEYNPLALLMKLLHMGSGAVKAPPSMAGDEPMAMLRNALGEAINQAPALAGPPMARGAARAYRGAFPEGPPEAPPRGTTPQQRGAKMEDLPVPIVDPLARATATREARQAGTEPAIPEADVTRGQLTREPVQLRRESQISQTDVGAPIRDVYVDQNAKLLENLDVLRGRTGGRASTETEVGRRVAGEAEAGRPGAEGALTQQAAEARRGVDKLYNQARAAGEMEAKVETKPLLNFLAKHEDPAMVSYAVDRLKRLKLIKEDEFGNIVPTNAEGPMSGVLSLNELESVRKAASAATQDGGSKAHYARELIGEIDKLTEGAGGEAYKAARKARYDYGTRFEEPKAIDQLLARKSRTDRAVALEDVWDKTVRGGSISDLARVRDTLLDSGGDRRMRDSGRKAWRDIAGQTVQHIKEQATKSAAMDEAGRPNLSADAIKKAIDGIGDEKLTLILGDTATRQLRSLAEVASDLKTKPPARIAGSDTNVNLMLRFNRVLDHIPILGPFSRGLARMGARAYDEGVAGKQVRESLSPLPTEESGPSRPPIDPRLKTMAIYGAQQAPQGPPPQ